MRLTRLALSVVAESAATLFLCSVVIFLAIHLVPGGFVDVFVPPGAPESFRRALAHRYGLDQPLPAQYWHWLSAGVHGDFGTSLLSSQTVAYEFSVRLPATLELTVLAACLACLFGVSAGFVAAMAGTSRLAHGLSRLVAGAGLSIPDFVLGSLLVYFFSLHSLGPTIGAYVPINVSLVDNLRAMALPALTLSMFTSAVVMRVQRDSILNVLSEPFISAAVARGESPTQVVRRHVWRNAANPVVTVLAVSVGGLLGGALIVENVFAIPGIGHYIVAAVKARDYAVVQAGVMLAAIVFVSLNTLADIAYAVLDPRVRR